MIDNNLQFTFNHHGQLSLEKNGVLIYEDLFLVCTFPLSNPYEYIAVFNFDGEEVAFIEKLHELTSTSQQAIQQELEKTLFIPEITQIIKGSSDTLPAHLTVNTKNGFTQLTVLKEEDIRLVAQHQLLITDSLQQAFIIKDLTKLDKKSKKIIEHYCILHNT